MKKNIVELTLEDQALLTYFNSLRSHNQFSCCIEDEEISLNLYPGSLEDKVRRLIKIKALVELETYVDDMTDQTISNFSLTKQANEIDEFDLPLGVILCRTYHWEERLKLLGIRIECLKNLDKIEAVEFLYTLAKLSEEALKRSLDQIVYYNRELSISYSLQDKLDAEINELESKIRHQGLKIISLRNLFHQSAPDFSEQTLTVRKISTEIPMK